MAIPYVRPARSLTVFGVGLVWLIVTSVLGLSGVSEQLQPPFPQVILLGLTATLVLAFALHRPFRKWALSLDPRAVVAWHLTRFVAGGSFLVVSNLGALPGSFAVPASVGDMAVAILAAGLLLTVRPYDTNGRTLYLIWNLLGLADIIGVVASAAYHAMSDRPSMAALVRMPLWLLPSFLVPIVIASHLLVWILLARRPTIPQIIED